MVWTNHKHGAVLALVRAADGLAKDRDSAHLPAWRAFNKAIGTNGDVGIWHETYVVSPGSFENIYVNMPPFGLGKVGALVSASGQKATVEGRLTASD